MCAEAAWKPLGGAGESLIHFHGVTEGCWPVPVLLGAPGGARIKKGVLGQRGTEHVPGRGAGAQVQGEGWGRERLLVSSDPFSDTFVLSHLSLSSSDWLVTALCQLPPMPWLRGSLGTPLIVPQACQHGFGFLVPWLSL